MKFKTPYNYTMAPSIEPDKKDMTVQNQALSIAQMLQQLQGGIPLEFAQMQYPDNEEDIQLKINDLSDIDFIKGLILESEALINSEREKLQEIKAKILAEKEPTE